MILLQMEYKPSELAEDLGIDVRTIYRQYLPAGAPHRRDENGLIWIVGTQFRDWLEKQAEDLKDKPKSTMSDTEGYCLRCQKRTEFADGAEEVRKHARLARVGRCRDCGARMSRYVKEPT